MKANPYAVVAGIVGVAFVVWLFLSMARTEFANRLLITLAACVVLVGIAGALGMIGKPGGDRSASADGDSEREG